MDSTCSSKLVLALDIGTSKISTLAATVDTNAVVAHCTCANDTKTECAREHHEQAPALILELCFECLRDCLNQPGVQAENVAAIAITGQMHSVLLVDSAGRPLTSLVTWLDRRTLEEGPGFLGASKQALPENYGQTTGCDLHPGYGGATLAWWSARNALPSGCLALTISDYVAAALCGKHATDVTHAASWGLLDIESLAWHDTVLQALKIPKSILPEIRQGATMLGRLTEPAAARLGLPQHVTVHVPLGDNQASVIGATSVRDDRAVVHLGTGGQVSIPHRSFRYVPGLETRPMLPGGYLIVGATICGGLASAYLCRFFREVARILTGLDVPEADVYRCLNDLAASAQDDADGLEADTRFAGTRGNPHVRGHIKGISVDNFIPKNFARAIIEGAVQELADLAYAAGLEGASGLVASGSAVHQNPILLDIIQQRFRIPCRLTNHAHASALGAIRLLSGYLRRMQPAQTN